MRRRQKPQSPQNTILTPSAKLGAAVWLITTGLPRHACAIDIAWPQVIHKKLIIAKNIQQQKAIMIIVAMKETPLLHAVPVGRAI